MKRFFDNIFGKTSTTSVSIVEKTHFDGDSFIKEINIDEDKKVLNERIKSMNDRHLHTGKFNKNNTLNYKVVFKLNLRKKPEDLKIDNLLTYANIISRYKAHIELKKHYAERLLGSEDDGKRTHYYGYLLENWLEIEPYFTMNGEIAKGVLSSMIKVFPIYYENIGVLQDLDGSRKVNKKVINILENDVNYYLQNIIITETKIFIRECLNIMSPKP